ncbi:Trk family potassium uptake protein [Oscillibacter valericigenes]|nr:Trk family potassium uptake protein [Oscillibacter valericigenes]
MSLLPKRAEGTIEVRRGITVFFRRKHQMTPARIILIGFALLILAGALLLTLPISTRDGQGASFFDALFTATSATCVTGLVVQDTSLYWSGFGQAVIILLIQIGGMGVVTVAVAISMLAGRRIGLKERWVMQESISAPQVGGIVRRTRFILTAMLLLEGAGAVLLALRFCPEMGLRGIWYAVFHAISSFCNAGFDLMGAEAGAPYVSLTGHVGDPLVNLTVMGLIVVGGIGFLTWGDVREHKWHLRSYCLQSKLVLVTTALLILLPALFFLCYEFRLPQWEGMTLGEKVLASLFQSVTPRTAGYNTVDLTQLTESSQLVMILLMLIGGAPGSTAGGFKVTTAAVFFLAARAVFRRREDLQSFGRRLPVETLRSASAILLMYVGLFLLGGMAISCVEGVPLLAALFETASAIGTVGLTLGLTPELEGISRMILIFLMYFGRVGGLTLIYAVLPDSAAVPAQMPQERINVG